MSGPITLRRALVLQEAVRQGDNAGGFLETWTDLGTVWAELRAGFGRERNGLAASISSVPYRIILRATPVGAASRPKAGQRFLEGTRTFALLAVAELKEDDRYLVCYCKEEIST